MKNYFKSIAIASLSLALVSCDNFLTYEPSDSIEDATAISSATDVENALNGVYYTLGRSEFYGRNVIALGDIAADNCWMLGTSGHFSSIYEYTVTAEDGEMSDTWTRGYQVIDRSARLIKAGEALLASGELSESDMNAVKGALAQAYAIKALAHFTLVNIYALPYNQENKSTLGLVNVDKEPFEAFQEVKRGTVEETYNQILADIQSAKTSIDLVANDYFRFNAAALSALEARVKLYMSDWKGAITAAQEAIQKRNGALEMDAEKYFNMWFSIAITSEDIFTISKTADDNLSANSINTLYGSYDGKATSGLQELFEENDMRNALFAGKGEQLRALKFDGLPDSKATSNVPVFRLPEMYLILAEANAQTGDTQAAIDNLFAVAKRNPDLKKEDIPTTKADLLKFISVERRRELFQEGHRWYDLRRTGELMTRVGGNVAITNWDASKFVYPIPTNEVNASGLAQNENWFNYLPKK